MTNRLWKLLNNRLFIGFLGGIATLLIFDYFIEYTSSDQFCESCHVHPHVTKSWQLSTHYDNKNGVIVHCVECHLPPGGIKYYTEKTRLGIKDIYGKLFKSQDDFNWEEKSLLEHGITFTYKKSCIRCHQNLFPLKLSKKGEEAHLYYTQNPEKLRCLNCHLHVGHFSQQAQQEFVLFKAEKKSEKSYTKPAQVEKFENYPEFIPASMVKFEMIAIPGGTFKMGSPDSEPYRGQDEGPVRTVKISRFWMAKTEVTWDEYEVFYRQTRAEGRTDTRQLYKQKVSEHDAITGATPPYTNPDQGWGKGSRPAITMTHHAAMVYCEWLSKVTGKKYRLPTEAEWEFACRGGTEGPYFFDGDPKDFTTKRFRNKIFGIDTTEINSYIIYAQNSRGKTALSEKVKPNPFGLLNMPGNVREFCLDRYSADSYSGFPGGVTYPEGPETGEKFVIRGGSFKSDAVYVRSASRDYTRQKKWLVTDPQIPKSIWWYSDCNDVGFRVVCEDELSK